MRPAARQMVTWAHDRDLQFRLIEPGKPKRNGYDEQLNGRSAFLSRTTYPLKERTSYPFPHTVAYQAVWANIGEARARREAVSSMRHRGGRIVWPPETSMH